MWSNRSTPTLLQCIRCRSRSRSSIGSVSLNIQFYQIRNPLNLILIYLQFSRRRCWKAFPPLWWFIHMVRCREILAWSPTWACFSTTKNPSGGASSTSSGTLGLHTCWEGSPHEVPEVERCSPYHNWCFNCQGEGGVTHLLMLEIKTSFCKLLEKYIDRLQIFKEIQNKYHSSPKDMIFCLTIKESQINFHCLELESDSAITDEIKEVLEKALRLNHLSSISVFVQATTQD